MSVQSRSDESYVVTSSLPAEPNPYKNTDDTQTATQDKIDVICDEVKELLKYKNRKYGDSALYPVRVFSNVDSKEQLMIRLDDKLSRVQNSDQLAKNDVVDIIGYLVLVMAKKQWIDLSDLRD